MAKKNRSIESHPHRVADATTPEGTDPTEAPTASVVSPRDAAPDEDDQAPEAADHLPLPDAQQLRKGGKLGQRTRRPIRVTVSKKEDGYLPAKDGSGEPVPHHGKPMYCVQWHDVYGVTDPKTGLAKPSPKHGRCILLATAQTRPIMDLDGKTGAAWAYSAARFCIDCMDPEVDLCPLTRTSGKHRERIVQLHDHLIDLVEEEERGGSGS